MCKAILDSKIIQTNNPNNPSNSDQSSTPSADDANSTLALVLPLEPTRTARYRPILARHVQISIIGGAASSADREKIRKQASACVQIVS